MRKFGEIASGAAMVLALVGSTGCGSDGGGGAPGPDASVGGSSGSGAGTTSTGGRNGSSGGGNRDGGMGGSAGTGDGGSAGSGDGGSAGSGDGGSAGSGDGGSAGSGDGGSAGSGDGGSAGSGDGGADAGTGDGGTGGAGNPVTLSVDVSAGVHAISPLIYGINTDGIACSNASARFSLCRKSGNPWSTYNWENNASNTGNDAGKTLCSENNGALGASDTPAEPVTSLVDEAGTRATLVTIPMLDHVAADKNAGTAPPDCSGDVTKSGSDYLTTRFKANRPRKGAALDTSPDTTDGFVNQDEFVSFVKAHAPTARVVFALDNQPELWSATHQPVHPNHATYAEVIAKNADYARMVRDQWAGAEITGFVGYGFQAFVDLQDAPNRTGLPDFVTYYLSEMKKASDTAGQRLVDYLDLHWYSEAVGGSSRVIWQDTNPPDPAVVAARVQAPRSLWDSTYKENSWIANDYMGGPINLLQWLGQRISANYPGTKLAFSSWAYGGEAHISGAIAAADALGVFGRESVALAAAQSFATDSSFLVGAFAAYRNYDGAGAAFGDTSVGATTSDVSRVSIYASKDSTVADRVVLVVINRSSAQVPTTLTIQNATAYSKAAVFQLTDQSATPAAAAGLVATGSNVFSFTPPAYSISVIVPAP